jgi:hypothetical protein
MLLMVFLLSGTGQDAMPIRSLFMVEAVEVVQAVEVVEVVQAVEARSRQMTRRAAPNS